MEDVLELYAEAAEESRPVICFDEHRATHWWSLGPGCPEAGQASAIDYEYVRTAPRTSSCLSMPPSVAPREGHRPPRIERLRRVHARSGRAALSEVRLIPHRDGQPVTHTPAALYETSNREARRILRRLEFHYTAEACGLAEHGGDRDRGHGVAVLGPPHPTKAMLVSE